MRTRLQTSYHDIISVENLLAAWQEFLPGKRKKHDVQEFGRNLFDNIYTLHQELVSLAYVHGGYQSFTVNDPKQRDIHKASVRDRVLHHAIYRKLYPFFDRTFIFDSYSCRINKGSHRALGRFFNFARRISHNHKQTVWVLKCDIKKFFASINQRILIGILSEYIQDKNILLLLKNVIGSFETTSSRGLPLGNLTSQLFCNIYMNEFDQFVKHRLKVKYYIRYADDFVFLSSDRDWLSEVVLPSINEFLVSKLKFEIHQDKIILKTVASGVDFLGWVNFSYNRILRRTTKRRILRRISENPQNQTLQSYLGLLSHGATNKIRQQVLNSYYLLRP